MKPSTWLAALALLGSGPAIAQQKSSTEITPLSQEAIKNWRDARFGMFIHWGPVSLKGTEIGWSRGNQVPVEVYDNLYKEFNPTKFNADEWVAIAKAAGMKYLVLTTKHHDGFCLWDSKETDYDIMSTPFKRDVVKELSEACKKGGIAFGTYYSTCDWHHPDFPLTSPGGKTARETHNLDRYTDYLKAQTRELLAYGPLFTLWYDVPQKFDPVRGAGVINMARAIQPDIVINNRTGHPGDYETPEQRVGGFNVDRPWETCMTICNQWAWKPNDKMKSLEECLHTLLRTNGGDGNLLFNVGPQPDGLIEARQVERLKEMGAWLKLHGETVYGTRGGPWKPTANLVSTRKGNKIFLHLLKKSAEPVEIAALPVAVKSAKIFNGAAVSTRISDGKLVLQVPANAWQAIDTIVELTIDGDAMDIAPLHAIPGDGIPGAKASASAVYNGQSEFDAAKAIDGDPDTRWASPEGKQPAWFQIDLPQETSISSVEIDEAEAQHGSRVNSYEILAKSGSKWKVVHQGKELGEHFHADFPAVKSSAVRIDFKSTSNGPTISEIRLPKAAR